MATRIFAREQVLELKDAVSFRRCGAAAQQVSRESPAVPRSAFRGLFYVILFDALILLAAFGAWELWRHVR